MSNVQLPKHECDLIMKGGITSGIVYPGAIEVLSKHYRFRAIGGASAGAIAAACTAAAEFNRETRPDVFKEIGQLPTDLGSSDQGTGQTRMLDLFQPESGTKDAFRWLLSTLGTTTKTGPLVFLLKLSRLWIASFRHFPMGGLIGVLATACVLLASLDGWARCVLDRDNGVEVDTDDPEETGIYAGRYPKPRSRLRVMPRD